jgi:hypothetical protein
MHRSGAFFCRGLFQGIAVPMACRMGHLPFLSLLAKVASMRHKFAQLGPSLDYGAKIAIKMMSGIRR